MGKESKKKKKKEERVDICICVIHFAVHLKLTQHCKSTILQLKKPNQTKTKPSYGVQGTQSESHCLHVGPGGPIGPLCPFLDGASSPPPSLAPFQPLGPPPRCSFHKHRQPLGLCTGCSLCLEDSLPSNPLGLGPLAPCKGFSAHHLT